MYKVKLHFFEFNLSLKIYLIQELPEEPARRAKTDTDPEKKHPPGAFCGASQNHQKSIQEQARDCDQTRGWD